MTSETFDVRDLVGQMVRVRRAGKSQHAIIGRLLQIRGAEGEVQLANHRGTEWLELDQIRPWKKGQAQDVERLAKREQNGATVTAEIRATAAGATSPKAKAQDGRWTEEERAARAFRASLSPHDLAILDATAELRAAAKSRDDAKEIEVEAVVAMEALRDQLRVAETSCATAGQLVRDEQAKVDAARAKLTALVQGGRRVSAVHDPGWSKFERAWPTRNKALDDEGWRDFISHMEADRIRIWQNNRFQVHWHSPEMVRMAGMVGEDWPDIVWLSIRRRDRSTVKDWRDLQRIKNEIVGHKHEAVELYPMTKRLVDSSNQYHLWVLATPEACFPIGYRKRDVLTDPAEARAIGALQRGFSAEHLSIITEDPTP